MTWTFCVPQLPARDVPAAQSWYRDVLGLEVNWLWEDNFGSVGQDCVELFLYESNEPHPTYVSLFVDDVDAVYAACGERGGEVVSELEDKPWNVREFTIRDPNGHLLRIGSAIAQTAELQPELTVTSRLDG
jgi:catechol 2,3-dioxygenase-like lactoylglutathione lyase family enzyme